MTRGSEKAKNVWKIEVTNNSETRDCLGDLKPQVIKPKERDIQKQIKEYLQWHDYFVVKIHQSLGSYPGIADLYALKDGRGIWIEIKTAAGKQSAAQKEFQKQVEEHGGTYILARRIEDVKDETKSNLKRKIGGYNGKI